MLVIFSSPTSTHPMKKGFISRQHATSIYGFVHSFVSFVICVSNKNLRPLLSKVGINQGVMVGGIQPLVKEDLRWKMTFIGRRPSVGRPPLVEDNLHQKNFESPPPWTLMSPPGEQFSAGLSRDFISFCLHIYEYQQI